jgi:trehalose 6-phosphate synthase
MSEITVDAQRPRLHLVANRLPVTWSPSTGWERAPGGLVTALESYVRRHRTAWIGSSASLGEQTTPPVWPHGELRQVEIEPTFAELAVDAMSNSCLWPALHGLTDRVRWRDEWWIGYRRHNEQFARKVAETAGDGELVWVHDYQLLLVPQMLAAMRPDLTVGLSIHTPVDAAGLGELPIADELVAALAHPSLIGVQTETDRSALVEFCAARRDVEVDGDVDGDVDVVVSPVSIDPEELSALAHERATTTLVERLRARLGARRLIVGIDRIDHTKGLLQRIDGIDRAFRQGSVGPDDVEIVQIAQPSRTALATSRELRLDIERRAHEVASHWLRSDGTPALRVITEGRDRRQVAALLAAADIALVTPVRDGMNLVAKEFAIHNEPRAGVLVLSRGAGAAHELGDAAVLVDGGDAASVADGLARAIALDAATRRDMARRRAHAVRSWTSEHWASDFERRLVDAQVSLDRSTG